MLHRAILLIALVGLVGCQSASYETIKPNVIYVPQERDVSHFEAPYSPLETDRTTDWGREIVVGDAFAKELDLYRALTAYKRALILLPPDAKDRRHQIEMDILLCYALGGKQREVVQAFESSTLAEVDATFPLYHELLIILIEAYRATDELGKAEALQKLFHDTFPDDATRLSIGQAIRKGDIGVLACLTAGHESEADIAELTEFYYRHRKSPRKAQALSAILPGAGYAYLGLHKSAITSFLINTLFIWAAGDFFHRGNIAAGVLTVGFEAGWYVGGIVGTGMAAQEYNERLWETNSKEIMLNHRLFPLTLWHHAF